MADSEHDPQVTKTLEIMRAVFSEDLVGAYLFGSATSTLRTNSDLDLMAVATRPSTPEEKRQLIDGLLGISGLPRHLELTMVVASEIKPWRYPPRMDFQYGDWWRREFEQGALEPWETPVNPDLTTLIMMVLAAHTPLIGPPPEEVFEPIPRADFVRASLDGIDGLLNDLEGDTGNVVLTLARVWRNLATEELGSKDEAANWALRALPSQHHRALLEARDIYLGSREPWATAPIDDAHAIASHMVGEIRRIAQSAERR